MDIQTTISVLGLLGLGGIMGSYIQHLFNKRREIDLEIRKINEDRYRSTLVWMRIFLKPENLKHFNLNDPFTNHKVIHSINNKEEIKEYAKEKITEYYHNGFLYAPNEILINIRIFLENPNEKNYIKTALSMRRDLWHKY